MSRFKHLSIIVIEDEPGIRAHIVDTLSYEFGTILEAENGKQAYEIIKTHSIDLVVSDIRMPVMTGDVLLKKLRSENIQIPTVFITAYGDEATRARMKEIGAIDVIEKPFEPSELMIRLYRIFDTQKKESA